MKTFPLCSFLIITLFISGCATGPQIQSTADPNEDFSKFSSFAILPLPNEIEGGRPGNLLRLKPVIESAIREGFLEMGFSEADVESADFVVHVKGQIVPKTEVTDWGYMGYPTFGYASRRVWLQTYPLGNVTVDNYEEGTLAIEAFERDTKELVWVGWATKRVSRSPEEAEVRSAIKDIVATFPGS